MKKRRLKIGVPQLENDKMHEKCSHICVKTQLQSSKYGVILAGTADMSVLLLLLEGDSNNVALWPTSDFGQ